MANYKVVDSDQLDADLTTVANAIRERAGTSAKMDFPSGFKDIVNSIPQGVELPELGDKAAQPSDIAYGKVLYDDEGNPVTGTLGESEVGTSVWASDVSLTGTPGDTTFTIGGVYGKSYIGSDTFHGFICRPGTEFWLRDVSTSMFGNATKDQVAKGVKFTSAAGLLVDGTREEPTAETWVLTLQDGSTVEKVVHIE